MHEVGIMESALDAIRHQAVKHGADRVTRIVLRIGVLAGVDEQALRFAFEALAPHSVAAGAALEIETVPARVHCPGCGAEFGVERGFIFQCPQCHEYSGDIRAGRELGIARLEFSTP
ncbi:MAG TPA: hydrogenase maturation nickel metallochaperone HypA [Lacunisphaera sp.]|nr:hydrogenase maturation nickel metallochaperone HypA [Lacunisphaera sp.]